MANKYKNRNIFESDFDSFELDDGFLLKVNADQKKNSLPKKQGSNIKKSNSNGEQKSKTNEKDNGKTGNDSNYCDLPLFIEDFNDSDFFEAKSTTTHSSNTKVDSIQLDGKGKSLSLNNSQKSCLSPILGSNSFTRTKISSSTPLKPIDETNTDNKPKSQQDGVHNLPKISEFDYLEPDLFEDWNIDESNKGASQKDTLTLSQALQLIEDAESAQVKAADQSIDLLTGEIVGADVENLFAQSFDKMKSVEKIHNNDEKNSSSSSAASVIVIDDSKAKPKPQAAQKLNFDFKDSKQTKENIKDCGSICFSSDDDFDFFTRDLLEKVKKKSSSVQTNQSVQCVSSKKHETKDSVVQYDSSESSEDVINLKKRKNLIVIESDTTEESPSPKFRRQQKRQAKTRKQRNCQNSRRQFIDSEAEVSEDIEMSSDEVDDDGEYDKSFLDEESYLTQNCSADMTAKYLQSVKGVTSRGIFKIPAPKPYIPEDIFSQISEENNTDYQLDSFCVNDVEEEVKTDLSDLEIAEKILEMDRKKKVKKRSYKSRKVK